MMEATFSTAATNANPGLETLTISTSHINSSGMMSDGMSEPSSPESSFDASDLLGSGVTDEVTAQLVAAGTVGMAAAAAIASARKRKRPHAFETNPSIRKRQQTRLLRKLKNTIEEYTTRVGQQAVVLCCTPGKSSQSNNNYKVFGSQPLENVVRNCKGVVLQDLETTLTEQVPNPSTELGAHELPPLSIDGIPTSVDKMTQAQLRTFIPEMLKYSTGRSKPGWGKVECQPVWWPDDVPWANVRSDVRSPEEKKRVSWTEVLRTIVKNCYKHHGREDLLNIFCNETNPAGTVLQTINNPDGTVSIIQIETGHNQVVTLPDGTKATVVHAVNPVQTQDGTQCEATQAVQTLSEVAPDHQEVTAVANSQVTPVSVEMNTEAVGHGMATISEDGQIILSSDGTIGAGTAGIVTIPVSVYQSVSLGQETPQGSLHVAMAPMAVTKQEDLSDTFATRNVVNNDVVIATISDDSEENIEPKLEQCIDDC